MVHGTPLDELGERAIPLKNTFTVAAIALAQGQAIPSETQRLTRKPFTPAWMYYLIGSISWRLEAMRWGAYKD